MWKPAPVMGRPMATHTTTVYPQMNENTNAISDKLAQLREQAIRENYQVHAAAAA